MSYPNPDIPSARPRPRPQKQNHPHATTTARESNALRASVLDAALQLGLANNSAVADWMFSNPLREEDEDQILNSPGLTHSEESPTSSPLSGLYPLTPSSPSSQNHSTSPNHGISNFHLQHPNSIPFAISSESHSLIPHVPDAPNAPPRPVTPSKLKKKRSANRDGYESEGSVISDTKRKKDKKKGKDSGNVPPVPALFLPSVSSSSASFLTVPDAASEITVGGSESGKRKKSLTKASPKSKVAVSAPASPFDSVGYETDASKKSKKKRWGKKNVDDEDKDQKKSRGLFFKLGSKSSKGDLKKEKETLMSPGRKDGKPPVLPIAERFATVLNKETGAPMISLGHNDGQTQPGGGGPNGLGIDLGLGLSGDMFSTTSPPGQTRMPAPPIVTPSSPTEAYMPSLSPYIISNSTPPVSFPSSPISTSTGRPGSAETTASTGTTTRTSTTSQSTGAARTSLATSVSTSQSHSHSGVPLKGVPSREFPNIDVPNSVSSSRPSTAASASSASIITPVPSPIPTPTLTSAFLQTSSKRRVLPFLGGGTSGTRGSSSSGDSEKVKEKERKREKEEKKREKEKAKEEKGTKHKPVISLPLTRAGAEASEMMLTSTNLVVPSTNPAAPPTSSPSAPSTPHRPRRPAADASRSPSHPPVSGAQFQNQQGTSTLLRQTSLPQIHTHGVGLTRQVSMSTLRADGPSPTGSTSPIPLTRSASPLPSGRISPMPRSMSHGSPPGNGRLSPLPAPPNVFAHYDIPPPSPPPSSPLPSVPTNTAGGNMPPSTMTNGRLSVNVGIAVTTGSPLPSPFLVTSPHYNSPGGVSANGAGGKVPPTSFNPSPAAAASALRAKVQRRLSQQGGLPTPSVNGESTPSAAGGIPVINEPVLGRSMSTRGRESPFPVAPLNRDKAVASPNGNLSVTSHSRAVSPRSGWDDSSSSSSSDKYIIRSKNDTVVTQPQEEYDDEDVMEGIRDVITRFRESRIDDDWGRKMAEAREAAEGVIATRRSFEALASGVAGGSANGFEHVPVSPSPSSGLNVPIGDDGKARSGRYDSFAIEEYYGHSGSSSDPRGYEGNGFAYDEEDEEEDASHYPDDEIARRSRRRRSTVYLSDEEREEWSGHGHTGGGKGRNSRWSGSIYSRASFLDTEKSGDARQRFLKHVEAMLDERGERIPAVPPVPKLPEEFVAESKRAAAAAKKEYEEFVVKRTVGVGARKVPAGSGR